MAQPNFMIKYNKYLEKIMVVEYYVDYGLKIIIIIIIPNQSWLATAKAITVMPPI